MPLILVVERDGRVAGRVRRALEPEGWTVVHARGVTEAMQTVASEAPDLFLVAAELEGAGKVLSSFARRQGGPGTVALLPQDLPGAADVPSAAARLGADAGLPRSFEAGELRAVVEGILRSGDRPAGPAADEPKLTSQDIFGDLVAEVESGADFPAAPPPSAAPPEPVLPKHRGPADAEIERKLEETLSGVLGWVPKERTTAVPRSRQPSSDVDKLLSDTLSGLELPAGRRRRSEPPPATGTAPEPPPQAPPPEAPRKAAGPAARREFGLSDLEALLARPRKAAAPASFPSAAPPSTAPASPPSAAHAAPAPPTGPTGPTEPTEPAQPTEPEPSVEAAVPGEEPPVPPGAGEPRYRPELAEAMEEVPDEVAPERAAAAVGAAGTEFGQYRLLERIGVGGMAEVWKARMTGVEGFQKTVAIKRILPHLTDSPDFVEMFVDEAKLAAQLNHANVIHIYDLGKIGDDYYIAMEHVEGENLRRILERARERGKPMPVGLALHVAARLASALDHAHRKRDFDGRELGLVHRDVSPQNVLVGYEGTIKLCDFGIVKAVSKSSHTQRGALKGKLQYMSPEQAWGKSLDGRSDIFSVGALLFEMLTGRRLFVGDSEMEVLEAVRECRVTTPGELVPGIPGEVDAIVLRALAREPEDRFQSAGELAARIEEVLGGMRPALGPAPGQSELARYVAELFGRPPEAAEEGDRAAAGPVGAGAAAAVPVTGSLPDTAPGPDAGGPVPPEGTGAAAAPVPAVAPVGKVEPEEGGPRGKWLLVAAIAVALLAGGLLAWYLLERRGADGGAPEVQEAGVEAEPAPPPAAPAGGPAPGEAEDGPAAGEGGEGAEAAGTEIAAPEALQLGLEEKLAEREEALRRQYEAELAARERALKEQLDELQEPAPEPAPPPAPAAPAKAPPPPPAPEPVRKAPVEEVSAPPEAAPAETAAPAPVPPPPAPRPAPEPAPAPRPAPAVREGELVTMGPGVEPPKVVRFRRPEYPPIARRLRVEGEVVVAVLVDETGEVAETRLVRGASRDVGLDEAALAAARSATFQPATKNGVRVKMWTTLRIPFRL